MRYLKYFYAILTQNRYFLIGSSLTRISFGLLITYFYLIHYSQRHFIWGPNGLQPHERLQEELAATNNISLYQFSDSPLFFEIIFHLGLLVAIIFTLGYKGRMLSILNFIFTWSIQHANVIILDGGDNVMRIILFYLIFANTTAYFSIDVYRNKDQNIRNDINKPVTNSLHNLAILASIIQVCFMYLTSGLHKVMGEMWQNGTSLYYILQVNEYTHPVFKDLILSSDILLLIGAYSAIFIQISYPFLLLNRYTKYIAIISVILLHTGIAIVMGLFTFSATMIAIQFMLLTDIEYQTIHSFFQKQINKYKVKFYKKERHAN